MRLKATSWRAAVSAWTASALVATVAAGQTVTPEIEPNQSKATATAVIGMRPGDVITGVTTSTTLNGVENADMFRIRTAPAAAGLYEYRLSITSDNAAPLQGVLNGQSFGSSCIPSDGFTQLSLTTSGFIGPWYGAGQEETVYVTVAGSHLTPLPYSMQLSRQEVVVQAPPRALRPGTISISRIGSVGFVVGVYDELLRRSEPSRGPAGIVRTFSPGMYYVAFATISLYDAPVCLPPTTLTMDSMNCVAGRAGSSFAFSITDSEGSFAFQSVGGILTWIRLFVENPPHCGSIDFDGDGSTGTDLDIDAFFHCLAGFCCETCDAQGADFNGDGDLGTDQDIEAFFRLLGGASC